MSLIRKSVRMNDSKLKAGETLVKKKDKEKLTEAEEEEFWNKKKENLIKSREFGSELEIEAFIENEKIKKKLNELPFKPIVSEADSLLDLMNINDNKFPFSALYDVEFLKIVKNSNTVFSILKYLLPLYRKMIPYFSSSPNSSCHSIDASDLSDTSQSTYKQSSPDKQQSVHNSLPSSPNPPEFFAISPLSSTANITQSCLSPRCCQNDTRTYSNLEFSTSASTSYLESNLEDNGNNNTEHFKTSYKELPERSFSKLSSTVSDEYNTEKISNKDFTVFKQDSNKSSNNNDINNIKDGVVDVKVFSSEENDNSIKLSKILDNIRYKLQEDDEQTKLFLFYLDKKKEVEKFNFEKEKDIIYNDQIQVQTKFFFKPFFFIIAFRRIPYGASGGVNANRITNEIPLFIYFLILLFI
jgi:hypothetical protein